MKYQTKLYLGFISIAAVSSCIGLGVDAIKTRNFLFKMLRSTSMSIAASIATELDPELVGQIKTEQDEKLPAYQTLLQKLKKSRDANRREDLYVKFIYTIYPDPKDPHMFLFGVDAEESGRDFSPAGSKDPEAASDLLYDHLKEVYSFGDLTEDPWGVWMTGYAPILDKDGNYVATVGIDISAQFVYKNLNRLLLYGLFSFFLAFCFAVIIAMVLAMRVTRSLNVLKAATVEIGKGDLKYRVKLATHDEFEELSRSMNRMNEGLEEKDKLKKGFAHYVSQHVLEKIVKAGGTTMLGGEKRKITVLFSDIRNFTRISESMRPEQVVTVLNEYFTCMLDIIFKHNGTLDKLLGDGIMAEFGAPLDDPEQERNAVLTAIEMQEALLKLREKWEKEKNFKIEIGIGIHTGDAVVGSIGSEHRMEYTAIGDTVNVAARLESMTKEKKHPIIVSAVTFKALYKEFPYKHLGLLQLHGKEQPVDAYAILLKWEIEQNPPAPPKGS